MSKKSARWHAQLSGMGFTHYIYDAGGKGIASFYAELDDAKKGIQNALLGAKTPQLREAILVVLEDAKQRPGAYIYTDISPLEEVLAELEQEQLEAVR